MRIFQRFIFIISLLFSCSSALFAQDQLSGIVNSYTAVSAYEACDNAITVTSATAFAVGDRVVIMQMQGATVDQVEGPTFGQVTSLGNAGNYEFNTISAIAGNVITLGFSLERSYTFTGKVQLIRVSSHVDAAVSPGNLVTCLPWNGTTGGVVVIECSGTFFCNGEMNVAGQGFRGGLTCSSTDDVCPALSSLAMGFGAATGFGGIKGEGVAAFVPAVQYGRGPWANGGGGGNKLHSGGGGGANMGFGGQGGFQTSTCGAAVDNGGLGGYGFNYAGFNPGKVFLGGGGGAGDFTLNASNGAGKNGGGIILVRCGTQFTTGAADFGFIYAEGVSNLTTGTSTGNGMGGGGGGGSVLIEAPIVNGNFFIFAQGGLGGDNAITLPNDYGTGGGGGGGFVAFSGPQQTNGGVVVFGGEAGDCTGSFSQPCYNNTNGATPGETSLLLGDLVFTASIDPFAGFVNGYLDSTLCVGQQVTISGNVFNAANPSGTVNYPGGSAAGCDSVLNVTLTYFPNVTGSFIDTLCPGQSVVLGGVTFNFTNPNGLATLVDGAASGCDSLVNVALTFLVPGSSTFTDELCPGETLTIGNTTFSQVNPSGLATIAGGSANGCDSLVTVTLTYEPQIVANLSVTGAVCPGEQALIQISLVNAAGFNIGSIDIQGGSDIQSFNNINSGFSFDVSPANSTVYAITDIVIAGYSCTPTIGTSANVVVTNLNPIINILSNYNGFDVSCANATDGIANVAVTGTPPYQYAWSNGASSATASNLPVGTNTVTIVDANNCADEVSFDLSAPEGIVFDTATVGPSCFAETDASLTIDTVYGGLSPYYISFDSQLAFPLPDSGFTYTNLAAGTFELTIFDDNGCEAVLPIFIAAPEELLIDFGNDTIINLGDSLTLNLQANFVPDTVIWSTLDGIFAIDTATVTVSPYYETTYTLTGIDTTTGCQATHSITVTISKERRVFAPTVFSPDGDDNNDIFYVFADPKIVRYISVMRIFDRWGTEVFEAKTFSPNDPNYGWRGYHRGELLVPQVFTYFFEIVYIDGRTQFFEGDITLVR